MEFTAFEAMLNASLVTHLGESGTLDGLPVRGIWDESPGIARLSGMPTGLQRPVFGLRDEDAAAVGAEMDSVMIVRGKTYRVVNIEPDGSGMTGLVLREEA